jgi:hypothetical protein
MTTKTKYSYRHELMDVEVCDLQMPHEQTRVAQVLYRGFCLEQAYVAAMPSLVKSTLV